MSAVTDLGGLDLAAGLLAVNPEEVSPGWVALLIVLGLGVALYFLWRSMNKQLGKVPPTFDEPDGTDEDEPTDGERPG